MGMETYPNTYDDFHQDMQLICKYLVRILKCHVVKDKIQTQSETVDFLVLTCHNKYIFSYILNIS